MENYKNKIAKIMRIMSLIYWIISLVGMIAAIGIGTRFEIVLISFLFNGMVTLLFIGLAEIIEILYLNKDTTEKIYKEKSGNEKLSEIYDLISKQNYKIDKLVSNMDQINIKEKVHSTKNIDYVSNTDQYLKVNDESDVLKIDDKGNNNMEVGELRSNRKMLIDR